MQFLSRSKLQLQNRTCKPGAIFTAICRRDIAVVSNMFEPWCNFGATKIASSCRDKNRLCKQALRPTQDDTRDKTEVIISILQRTFISLEKQMIPNTKLNYHFWNHSHNTNGKLTVYKTSWGSDGATSHWGFPLHQKVLLHKAKQHSCTGGQTQHVDMVLLTRGKLEAY